MTQDTADTLPDAALDAALAAYATAEPSAALRQRIVAIAPRERAMARRPTEAGEAALALMSRRTGKHAPHPAWRIAEAHSSMTPLASTSSPSRS